MKNFYIGTFGQVTAYNAKIDQLVTGFPTADNLTLTYADPLPHQGTLNGGGQPTEYLLPLESGYFPFLSRHGNIVDINAASNAAEIASRKNEDVLRAEGAFDWAYNGANQQ